MTRKKCPETIGESLIKIYIYIHIRSMSWNFCSVKDYYTFPGLLWMDHGNHAESGKCDCTVQ